MANFRTPKTDWAAEDGVLNDDFNRIEENIQFLYETAAKQARSSITYYVSSSGSDNNNGLSAAAPFATIQKALNSIPKDLGGYTVNIKLASGSYAGFTAANFSGGVLAFSAVAITNDIIITSAVTFDNCQAVLINGISSLQIRAATKILSTPSFLCSVDTTMSASSGNALEVTHSSAAFPLSLTVTSPTTSIGLLADYGSRVFVESFLAMAGTGTGIKADRGGMVAYSSSSNRADIETEIMRGGRILTGSLGGLS